MDRDHACIIAPIDFSEGASSAVRQGRWLSERTGMELRFLHVSGNGSPWRPDIAGAHWLEGAAIDPHKVDVRHGLAWVEIVRHAQEIGAALIVLGSHGASGFQPVTLGSTSTRVVLRSPCPVVLVAPEKVELGWRGPLSAERFEARQPHTRREES